MYHCLVMMLDRSASLGGLICSSLHDSRFCFWVGRIPFLFIWSWLFIAIPAFCLYYVDYRSFFIMYKLYVSLVILLSGEVLPDLALHFISISFLLLFKFCGKGF
jgi:hypothetical protein